MTTTTVHRERLAASAKALLSIKPDGYIPFDSSWARAVREVGRAWVDTNEQAWFFYKTAGYIDNVYQLRMVFEKDSGQWLKPEDSFWILD